MTRKILAFSGSARKGSFNKKLLSVVAQAVRERDLEVTEVDLADFPMPLFSEDLEAAGVPPEVRDFKQLAFEHAGYLIASPEYNGSVSPLLKNTLDWMSRKHDGEAHMAAYRGKVAAVVSASPGGLGGIRALPHLRYILEGVGTLVIPETLALGQAHNAFAGDGSLVDDGMRQRVAALAENLSRVTRALG